MDASEIRARYLENLEAKTLDLITRIDDLLVNCYREIESNKGVVELHLDIRNSRMKRDIIKNIQNHYIEHWDIEWKGKKTETYGIFIFTYKGDFLDTDSNESPKVITEEDKGDSFTREELIDL